MSDDDQSVDRVTFISPQLRSFITQSHSSPLDLSPFFTQSHSSPLDLSPFFTHREVRRRPGDGRVVARGAGGDAANGSVSEPPGGVRPDAVEAPHLLRDRYDGECPRHSSRRIDATPPPHTHAIRYIYVGGGGGRTAKISGSRPRSAQNCVSRSTSRPAKRPLPARGRMR